MAVHTDELIRAYMREFGGGTATEIAHQLGLRRGAVVANLKAMVDVYIDRYIENPSERAARMNPFIPVYEIAEIPPDCPMPEKK